MWRLITDPFTLDTSKELQRIRQRTMTLPCDHTRRLSYYIRALLSGLRSHSLVDCSNPSLRLLPANSLSSKDLALNVLNMATALVSMDCGLNTSVILDYRECCLYEFVLTHTNPQELDAKIPPARRCGFSLGGVDSATGKLTAIDLAAMERALRAVGAKHKDPPLVLTGEPDYASYLNAPAPDPTQEPSFLACMAITQRNPISSDTAMAAVGPAQLASYYDAPRVLSSALTRTRTALGPWHPHSSEGDARSRNFRVLYIYMAMGRLFAATPVADDHHGNSGHDDSLGLGV